MAGPFDDLIPAGGGAAVADAPAPAAGGNAFADLIPKAGGGGNNPFADLIPQTATPEQAQQLGDTAKFILDRTTGPGSLVFDNALMSLPEQYDPMAPGNQPMITPGKPQGLQETIRRALSALLGPTAAQQTEDAINFGKKDTQGNPVYEYKPLAGRPEKEGLLTASYLGAKPLPADPTDSSLKATGKAILNQGIGLENALLSPLGVATAGLGSEFPVAGRVISGAFAADMAAHVPGQLDQLANGKTLQDRIEGGLGAVVSLLTAGTAGTHALAGEHPSLETVISQTRAELDKAVPPSTPLTKEPFQIPDQTLDGLVQARQAAVDGMVKGKISSETGQPFVDHIDDTLLKVDKDQVRASEERVAAQRAQTPPAKGEAPPVTTGSPPAQGGTSSLFSRAKAEAKPPYDEGRDEPNTELTQPADPNRPRPGPVNLPITDFFPVEKTVPKAYAKGTEIEDLSKTKPTESVPLDKVVVAGDREGPLQGQVNEKISQYYRDTPETPKQSPVVLLEENGKLYGYSGFHRMAGAKMRGDTSVDAVVIRPEDLEKPNGGPQPITDPAMHQAAESQAQRIATQVTQGQGDIVREAAYNAAIDKARAGMAKGVNPSADLMRRAAKEAAGKAVEKAGVSLDAETEGAQPIANTVAAPAPAVENTEAVDAMHSAIDSALPERDAKIMKARAAGASMEDIGKEHGISKQAVSQIVDKSMPKIRAEMERKGITKEDIATSEARDWTQATAEPRGMLKKDFGEGAAAGSAGSSSKGVQVFKTKRMSELDRATGNRSAKLQRSFSDAESISKEVRKIAPKRETQGGISLWIEAGGDVAKLAAWEAGAKGKEFKAAAKAAQSLTPEQMDLARKIKATFGILEQRGNKYDVLGEHRDNYVPHVWDVGSKPVFGGGLKQNFKFNKARTFENFAEGDAAGFKPKTLEIGKLLPSYLEEMNRVIADRQFVEEISGAKAKDGRPLITPRGRVSELTTENEGKAYLANPDAIKGMKDKEGNPIDTSDYKVLDQPALHDWRWEGKDGEGNPIFMKDDLALHPEAVDRVNAMVGQSKLRQWANKLREGIGPNILPAAFRAVDTAQSVLKREMFSLLAPFHQVQEGAHAIAHLVNPLSGIPKIDLKSSEQIDAGKHGLMLLPDRTNAQQYLEGVGGKGGFIAQAARFLGEKTPLVGKAATALADVIDGYQKYLFHQYIPGLKFKTYGAILQRNLSRYGPEISRGELSQSDVKLLSAEQTNAAYGHLNYTMMDRSPTVQHFLRLGLLAPDFLEARGRFVGQAIKGATGSKVGAEQLKALATIAGIQAGLAYTITTLSGNKWDPKDPFSVVNGDRRYGMRTVPADIIHMVRDLRGFAYGRVNPLTVKTVDQLRTGLNYRGEKVGPLDTLEELLTSYIPITARQIPGIRQLTETSRQSPISPLEQLAGSLGVKVSRNSPINNTYSLAGDWMKDQKIAKKEGSYPISKFQQLRYALEDGDIDKAKTEYEKLKAAQTPAQIAKGFRESVDHPFTQNRTMDQKFANSLKPNDRAVYDLAVQKRRDILNRFNRFH